MIRFGVINRMIILRLQRVHTTRKARDRQFVARDRLCELRRKVLTFTTRVVWSCAYENKCFVVLEGLIVVMHPHKGWWSSVLIVFKMEKLYECEKCSYRTKHLHHATRHVNECKWITDISNKYMIRNGLCGGDIQEDTLKMAKDDVAVHQLAYLLQNRSILIDENPVRFELNTSIEAQEVFWTQNINYSKSLLASGGEDAEADYTRVARLCYYKHVIVQKNIRRGDNCVQTFNGDKWVDCQLFEETVISMMIADLKYLFEYGKRYASSPELREVARSLRPSLKDFIEKHLKPSRVPLKRTFVNFFKHSRFVTYTKRKPSYVCDVVRRIDNLTDAEITELVIPTLRYHAPWVLSIWESMRLSHLMKCDIPISLSSNGTFDYKRFYMKFKRFEELLDEIIQDPLNGTVKMILFRMKISQEDRIKSQHERTVWRGTSWGSWKETTIEDWDSTVFELLKDLKRTSSVELAIKCKNAHDAIEQYDEEHGVAIGRKLWKELKL